MLGLWCIFIDYELRKGYELSPSLSKAIENSLVSVVVFSENYASSKWCLEELVKILECRAKHGQVVIPVFYNIDPSHVRKQEGSYKRAFEKHLQNSKLDMNKVQKWKHALDEAANLSGWDSHSRSYRDDSELIERIAKDVLQKLNYHYPSNSFTGLVNIDKKAAPIESLLSEALSVPAAWKTYGKDLCTELQKIPREEILNVLRLSYDGLNYEEQQIFLDIACFLKGISKTIVVDLLDCCDFYPVIGMRSLLDKALITISSNNTVEMHDLVQQMGWEIVRQESIRNPGKRSRLWDSDDVCDVLKNNKGTKAIHGIMLDMSQCRQNLCLSPDTFKKMRNLRYLRFFTSLGIDGRSCDLYLPTGLESLPDKLRYLEWHAGPLQSLPSNFCPENLVTLRMPQSQFKRLWSGVQNLVNLKEVDLADCRELIELPDFSKANNLESALESEVHLESLKQLHIEGCSSLRKFSLSIEAESLNFTSPVKLSHLTFGCLSKVKDMYVNGSRLENIPEEWSCLKSLRAFLLHSYSRVISKQTLQVIFDGLQYLRQLTLLNCHGLFELPDNINCLSSLQILELDGSAIERLPESIKHLSRLETLSLCNCKRLQSLPELPLSIINLKAFNCPLVQMEASSSTNSRPQDQECTITSFQNVVSSDEGKCIHLFRQSIRKLVDAYELRQRVGVGAIGWHRYLKIYYPDNRIPNWFTCQTKGSSISFELTQPLDHYFSFLLCVVLPPITTSDAKLLQIRYNCRLEDGRFSRSGIFPDSFAIMEDWDFPHVFMSFIQDGILDHIKQQRTLTQAWATARDHLTRTLLK
ncbi:hypothetical protein PIB30_051808 [Stylosanthes scabra]|uniref:TIR domain-containing protein n=1 Tax=Stylosanthes scabra TaxID=79078 RepID=A0ABU6VK05_9FABA|nr:hypothetical protein [Stylosanthes scabra]